jgi:uroporphyrinogen decarboxylase
MMRIERIRKALAGEPVDRPPISFWGHNYAQENSAADLAAETVRVFQKYDWDFIKIQSRASCFAEAWGNRYHYSSHFATSPAVAEWAVHSVEDLQSLRPVDPRQGALGEQLEALRMIRQEVGPDVPLLQTIFAPAMVLGYLTNGPANMLSYVRQSPAAAHSALATIRETLVDYAQASIENGADGIFFAIKAADSDQVTRAEYAQFGLPYDRPVLDAASGWFNMLHLCGSHIYFEVVDDLPSALVNYDTLVADNPSIAEGRDRARRAIIGGVSHKPDLRNMTPEQAAAQVKTALDETQGVQILIGPGCSIAPDTPETNLRAAMNALTEWAS